MVVVYYIAVFFFESSLLWDLPPPQYFAAGPSLLTDTAHAHIDRAAGMSN